jgi:hypothetical protein
MGSMMIGAIGLRVDSQTAFTNGFLDFAHQCFVPDIDRHHPRFRYIHCADLVDGSHLPVSVHHHRIENRSAGPPRAQRGKFGFQRDHGPVHATLQVININI